MLIGIYMQYIFFFVIFFKMVAISHVSSLLLHILKFRLKKFAGSFKAVWLPVQPADGRPVAGGKYCLTKESVLGRIIKIRRNMRAAANQNNGLKSS
jgi:hypothetical protein